MKPVIRGLHHDHIDGSTALVGIIEELYALAGQPFPFPSIEAWREFFRNPWENIVKRFSTVTSVMQSAEALRRVGYAYGCHRADEGYLYVEAKFAPQYHVFGGLSLSQAVAAMYGGLKQAESERGIRILPQVCIGREVSPEQGVEIAKVVLDYAGEVALDLACDEAGHPPEKHLPAFRLTWGSPVRRDCHAGEWVDKEPVATYRQRLLRNVRTAVFDLRCHGIGHAIPLADDPMLVSYVADTGVRVAGCPASYLCGGLISDIRALRIDELLDRGVIYTLNSDDDLFLPSMSEVIEACDRAYAFTADERRKLEANVWRGAFAADAAKYVPQPAAAVAR